MAGSKPKASSTATAATKSSAAKAAAAGAGPHPGSPPSKRPASSKSTKSGAKHHGAPTPTSIGMPANATANVMPPLLVTTGHEDAKKTASTPASLTDALQQQQSISPVLNQRRPPTPQSRTLEIPGASIAQTSAASLPSSNPPASSSPRPGSGSTKDPVSPTQDRRNATATSTITERPTSAQKKVLIPDTTQTPLSAPIPSTSPVLVRKTKPVHVGSTTVSDAPSTTPSTQKHPETNSSGGSKQATGSKPSGSKPASSTGATASFSSSSRHRKSIPASTSSHRPKTSPGSIQMTSNDESDVLMDPDMKGISVPSLGGTSVPTTHRTDSKATTTPSPLPGKSVHLSTDSSSPNFATKRPSMSLASGSSMTPSTTQASTRTLTDTVSPTRSTSASSRSRIVLDASMSSNNPLSSQVSSSALQDDILKSLQHENRDLLATVNTLTDKVTVLEKRVKILEHRETVLTKEKDIALRDLDNHRKAGAGEKTNVEALKAQIAEEHAQNAALIVHNRSLKTQLCELEAVIESMLPTAPPDIAKHAAAVLKGLG